MEVSLKDIKYKNKVEKTAEELNSFWDSKGYDNPPYKTNTVAYNFELSKKAEFVRVYDDVHSGIKGQFVMKLEEITKADGSLLTAQQIKDKFALEYLPTKIAKVEIPAGTKMNCGIAGKIEGWGLGGGIQFDLNYTNTGIFTFWKNIQY
jgi:hypothetical protein